jgi:hypothetical protein
VDAWGVDYALLGERGELLQDPYHYRAVDSLREARAAIERSFAAEVYEPRETDHRDRQAERFRQYCGRSLCLQ